MIIVRNLKKKLYKIFIAISCIWRGQQFFRNYFTLTSSDVKIYMMYILVVMIVKQ